MKHTLSISLLFLSFIGLGQVHTTYLWHMQQPIYWPEQSQWDSNRYQTVWESDVLKNSGGNNYSDGLAHPLNDLFSIFSNADRVAAYQWRTKDAVNSLTGFAEGGAQLNYSGCLIENVNSLADAGQWGYNNNWESDIQTARSWTTTGGNPRMDVVGFGFHHVLAPLVSEEVLRKEIQAHKLIYGDTFGSSPEYSKGFWPAECSFSERIIKVLVEEGFEWSVVANSHLARTLSDYPLNYGTSGCNIDPPNAADVIPQAGNNWWSGQIDGRGGTFAAPFCYQAHKAQYVDPETGQAYTITVVPMADLLSYQNGFSLMGTGDIDNNIAPFNDNSQPCLVLMAHDGDNAWGGGFDYYQNSVPQFAQAAANQGYVPSTVQQFLDDHPVPANDLVHVEDGSWVNAANDWGHPQFINWLWPMYNGNFEFDSNGWTEDARNFAVLTAAENHVQMAEDLEGGADIFDIVYPSATSSSAERAWHFLLPGYTSGYMYYGTSLDMEVKQTLAANNALSHANPVIDANPGIDNTPPSVFIPQRYPYNPGGAGFGPTYGYQEHQNSSDFTVWTFAHDVNGLESMVLKYRVDDDGINPLSDNVNEVYAVQTGVGAWQEIAMTERVFPTGNVTGNGEVDFFMLPEEIANEYYGEITGLEDVLVDYYVESTDTYGNVFKTAIQHVFVGECNGCTQADAGCTDPAALNYDSTALTDDGSCEYTVIFHVDMSNETVDPAGVHLAGSFQGWDPAATLLNNDGGDIWWVEVVATAGMNEYKFINGNAWENEENVPGACGIDNGLGGFNRFVDVTGNLSIPVHCFASCTACSTEEVNLTLQVNMESEVVSPLGVHIAGDFQGWNPAATLMTDEGNGIWSYTTTFLAGTSIQYKFVNGDAWGMDESVPAECATGFNRTHTVGLSNEVLTPVCFGTCNECPVESNEGCTDSAACNWDSTATSDDGSCDYSCYGCTDSQACNFSLLATIDDGSCAYDCLYGCIYPEASNYNPLAIFDDGSCLFGDNFCGTGTAWDEALQQCVWTGECLADMTGDQVINTADLLALLATFGNNCD